jgi:hypothetical protein
MAVNERDAATVQQWLKDNTSSQTCPFCGHDGWHILDVANLAASKNGDLQLSGPNLPVVPLVCKRCNYTRFHAAVGMGLSSVPLREDGPEWSKE